MLKLLRHNLNTWRLLGLAIAILMLVGASACGARPGDWKMGSGLALRIPQTIVLDQISYSESANVREELLEVTTSTQTVLGRTAQIPILPSSELIKMSGVAQIRDVDYSIDYETGEITFFRPPTGEVTIDYTPFIRDEHLDPLSETPNTFGPTVSRPIRIGTDVVKIDGKVQVRDVDYTIAYQEGTVTFHTLPSGKVTIDYEEQMYYTLRPTQADNQLYLVRVIVLNNNANLLSLDVVEESVQLRGEINIEWNALDPYGEGRQQVEAPPADLDAYIPFIWGVFDLPLKYQIDGWVLFEVPKGTEPRGLRWDTGDTVLLNL